MLKALEQLVAGWRKSTRGNSPHYSVECGCATCHQKRECADELEAFIDAIPVCQEPMALVDEWHDRAVHFEQMGCATTTGIRQRDIPWDIPWGIREAARAREEMLTAIDEAIRPFWRGGRQDTIDYMVSQLLARRACGSIIRRPDGCQCHMEEGDSSCPVHGEEDT